jgi:FkbM family methyltransferase
LAHPSSPPTVRLGPLRLFAGSHNDLSFGFCEMFVKEEYAASLATSTPTIVDCGANSGIALLYFKSRYPGAKVTCFEPNPTCCALIERHVRENRLSDVTLRPVACGAAPGEASFFVNATDSIVSSFDRKRARADAEIKVPVVRLSDEITGPVDLLKIDIEGAEWEVLEDLVGSGKISFVRAMMVEYHHQIEGQSARLGRFLNLIEEAGFVYELAAEVSKGRRFKGSFQDVLIYASRMP